MNFNKNSIIEYLENKENYNIIFLNQTKSTNSDLKLMAKNGADEGTVIIADSQTGGKGRYDRKFYSPEGSGIYMSILLKPSLPPTESVMITAAAAVAVRNAVLNICGKSAEIKWVNDLILNNKKICGILTEGSVNTENNSFNWAVLGIGINVYEPENSFNDEIKNIAGAVADEKQINLRSRLCAKIINSFFEIYSSLEQKTFLNDYRSNSCVLNREITVIKNNEESGKAVALDIDDDCRLLVRYENGCEEYLSSGEISIKM